MATSPRIHPTAVISPEAELAEDVQVGPYAIIEGAVKLGAGCVVRPQAHLMGPLSAGKPFQPMARSDRAAIVIAL